MKKLITLGVAWIAALTVNAQITAEDMTVGQSCTSIMVGKKASATGEVITSHTCDGNYRSWMTMEPARDYAKGAMHPVWRGTLHTAFRNDTVGVKVMGVLPEAAHTYAYLNTAYPCLNEKQLAIGESTFVGPEQLRNPKGWFNIEELQRIALQRCDKARDAIRLIGDLIKQYGYGDYGECITIADRNEVWQMEIVGAGKNVIGGVWVAKRVADDEVAVSCNIPRIGKLERDSADFMCSDNVEKVALKNKLWDGKSEFCFWKAYNCEYAKGKNFLEREMFIYNSLLGEERFNMDMGELPYSIVPKAKVSVEKVMELLRATYEGTQYDMCKNLKAVVTKKDKDGKAYKDTIQSPVANPWMGGNMMRTLNYLDSTAVTFHRGVSVAWCSYSWVAQLRRELPDAVGGVVWMSVDNPAESPRIPIFCGTTKLPSAFDRCGNKVYGDDVAMWQYRKANKLATVAWQSTKGMINKAVLDEQARALNGLSSLEQNVKASLAKDAKADVSSLLNEYTYDVYLRTSNHWKQLEGKLWQRFGMGF